MYTNYDLIELEKLNDEELTVKLHEAKENYDYIQSLYSEEAEKHGEHLNLQIIFTQLKNIEYYIRRIENLLNEYENDIPVLKRIIVRRKKRLKKMEERLI